MDVGLMRDDLGFGLVDQGKDEALVDEGYKMDVVGCKGKVREHD